MVTWKQPAVYLYLPPPPKVSQSLCRAAAFISMFSCEVQREGLTALCAAGSRGDVTIGKTLTKTHVWLWTKPLSNLFVSPSFLLLCTLTSFNFSSLVSSLLPRLIPGAEVPSSYRGSSWRLSAIHGLQGSGGGAPSCTRWRNHPRGCDVSSHVPEGVPGVQGVHLWVGRPDNWIWIIITD